MKKVIAIISALLLVLSLSQCKKKAIVPDNTPKPVSITLDVNGGSKVNVNPATGEVAFQKGDVIYVAYNGKYVGFITGEEINNKVVFSGDISVSSISENKPLCFYFLGNQKPYEKLVKGTTTQLSVNIIEQTGKYPVISAAESDQPFTGSGSYTAKLANRCSLVKFNVETNSEDAPTIITGMNNKMDVTFDIDGSCVGKFSPTQIYNGIIGLKAGSGERWAILLKQDGLGEGGDSTAYSNDFLFKGYRGAMPAIDINQYVTDGIEVRVETPTYYTISDVLPGRFSVSPTKQVQFTKGNLRYYCDGNNSTWSFHDKQYNVVHTTYASNVSGEYQPNSQKYIDMFGWGCTGHRDTRNANPEDQEHYMPYDIAYTVGQSSSGYGPYFNANHYSLDNNYESDWGCNFSNSYYTLSSDEWVYLLNNRADANAKKGLATIETEGRKIKGFVILPDIYQTGGDHIAFQSGSGTFDNNVYSAAEWAIMEKEGAVFLPAAGKRTILNGGGSLGKEIISINIQCVYWTSSVGYNTQTSSFVEDSKRLLVRESTANNYTDAVSSHHRSLGCAVRLVRAVE